MYIDLRKKRDGAIIDAEMNWETTKRGSQHFCVGRRVYAEADFRRGLGFPLQVLSDGRVGLGASARALGWLLYGSFRLPFQLLHFHHTIVDGLPAMNAKFERESGDKKVAEAPNGSVRVQKVLSFHYWVIIPAHQVAHNSEIIEISAPPSPVTEFPDPPMAFY